ncbi:MAG: hypothetical protein ACJ76F_04130 [Bacteroidia bacterium]
MKPSEDLFQLIKSMNMSEKRHFKIHSSRHTIGETNNYERLFDAIEKQDAYNEAKIKRQFEGESFIRHLPSEKHYLYNHILESLNSFHKEKTFLSRYSNILISIELLYNRGLFDQCMKLIRKAKEEAYSLEKFSILLAILRRETIIYIKDEDAENLSANIDEELRVMETLRIQSILMKIAFNIQIQIDKGSISAEFMKAQTKALESNLPPTKNVNSFWAEYYYFSAKALIYSVQNKPAPRYVCYREIKALMDDSPQFIKDIPSVYHLNYNNLVNVMLFLKKFREAESLIEEQRLFLDTYKIRNPTLSKIVFINTCESELYLYYKAGQYQKAGITLANIEPEVRKIEPSFSPLLFDLFFFMAVTDLLIRNYKGASKWLNRILNSEREMKLRKELQINTRLLYLIVLYESDDRLFDSRMNATKRFLSREPHFKLQSAVFDAIRSLAEGANKKNKQDLKKSLPDLKKEQLKSSQVSLNKYFDFVEWVEKKQLGVIG